MSHQPSELVEMVRTWILLDTEVHTLTKTLADARKRKRSVTDQLMELIVRNSYEEVTLPQGTLVPRKQRRKSPLTKTQLTALLPADMVTRLLSQQTVKETKTLVYKKTPAPTTL